MIRRNFYLIAFLSLALAMVSCQAHDAFCFNHPHGAQVGVDVDWSEFKEDKVSGMSFILVPSMDSTQAIRHTTNEIEYMRFNLLPDEYTILVHNQGVSEFGTVAFSDMGQLSAARVFPERCSSDWYEPVEEEDLVQNPDWLAFDKKSFLITEDMIGEDAESYYKPRADVGADSLIATLTPKNVVYTLHISVQIKGINNYKAARAAISGMADGYLPGLERYDSLRVTHLVEMWKVGARSVNDDGVQEGTITSEITCFGLPAGHGGSSADNVLRLSLLLADNKTTINRMLEVGDRFYKRTSDGDTPHLYLELQLSEKLPDVVPVQENNNQNGFDAKVEDWGEEKSEEVLM